MKAITYDPARNDFVLKHIPVPTPGESDVLIKVDACGLNPVDAKIAQWKSMASAMDDQWVPGLDVSGLIVQAGRKVDRWRVGDRILCHGNMFRPHGGFAEYTIQDSEALIPHPAVAAEVAAATPCAGWTAWRALHDKLRIQERASILITGGSGGVGGFAIQIARQFGVKTIIATCSSRNRDYVRELGATHTLDYTNGDVVQRVRQITGQLGVAVGLDTVGRDNDIVVANSLAYEGEMVELVDLVRPESYRDAFLQGFSFHQLSLGSGHRSGPLGKAKLVAAGTRFSKLLEEGAISVRALRCVTLDEVGPALAEILKQRTVGKVVMKL